MRYCSQYVFDLYMIGIIIDEEFNVKTNICVFENQQEVDQFKNKDISIERHNGLTYVNFKWIQDTIDKKIKQDVKDCSLQ